MVTVAEYKTWAFCARAWYETNSMAIPKKALSYWRLLVVSPRKWFLRVYRLSWRWEVMAYSKKGEVLDANFGVDGCEGLLLAVREPIHGRGGHKPMLEHSLGVAEVLGLIQLQGVMIDPRLSGCDLPGNSDLSVNQKAMVLATTNRDVSCYSVQVALRNLFGDSQGFGAVTLVTDACNGAGSPSRKGKDTNQKGGSKGAGGPGRRGDGTITRFGCRKAGHVATDCWSPPRKKVGKGEFFVADAQEVQAEKKDQLVTEDSSQQYGGSYVGLCYMANSGFDVGLDCLQGLLTECLLKGLLGIGCTNTEAGSDPRGHLGVTWGVYLCAGKPPLADIILSHPPDLTRSDSVIGVAIPAMSGHIQYRGAASGDLYIGISGINRVFLS